MTDNYSIMDFKDGVVDRMILEVRPFTRSVALEGEENPAAHGGVCYVVLNTKDGATRLENVNGPHREVGPWVGSTRERLEAKEDLRRVRERIEGAEIQYGQYVLRGALSPDMRRVVIRVKTPFNDPLPAYTLYCTEVEGDSWTLRMSNLQRELTEIHRRLDASEV